MEDAVCSRYGYYLFELLTYLVDYYLHSTVVLIWYFVFTNVVYVIEHIMRGSFNSNLLTSACWYYIPSIMAKVFLPKQTDRQAGIPAGCRAIVVLSSLRGGKKVNHHNNRSEVG